MRFVIQSAEENQSSERIFAFLAVTIIVFASLSIYNNYFENCIKLLSDTVIYKKLYRKLYHQATNVELECFENSEFYNKYTMALESANTKVTATIDNIWSIFFGGIATVIAFIIMYQIDHYAILFVISPIIGNFVFGAILNKVTYRRYKEQTPYHRKLEYINRVIHLSDYAKEMRLTNVFRLMMKKYQEAMQGSIAVADKYSFKAIAAALFHHFFTFTFIFEGVLLYGAYQTIVAGNMRLSELAVLSSFMVSTTWILIGFSNSLIESFNNSLFIENLRKFLEYKPVIPEDYDGVMPEKEISSIEFCNVSFGYSKDKQIIKNLSFSIKGKQTVALVGHNGAGKSTIIKLLLRLYDPSEGVIFVNGRNIREYNLKTYRKLFSAAFQDYKILALTVKENVLMKKVSSKDDEAVQNALIKAKIYDKIM
jgi:ATP-binding cassette subfamily B protein